MEFASRDAGSVWRLGMLAGDGGCDDRETVVFSLCASRRYLEGRGVSQAGAEVLIHGRWREGVPAVS